MGSPVDIKNMAKHRETKYEFVSKTKERISIFMKEVSQSHLNYQIFNIKLKNMYRLDNNGKPRKLNFEFTNFLTKVKTQSYYTKFLHSNPYIHGRIFTFNYEENQYIMESAVSQDHRQINVGYFTNLIDQKKSSVYNLLEYSIVQIKDFPLTDRFIVLSQNTQGTIQLGLMMNIPSEQLKFKFLNFRGYKEMYNEIVLLPFKMRDFNSKKFSLYALVYSKYMKNGQNFMILVSPNFNGVLDFKIRIFNILQKVNFIDLIRKRYQKLVIDKIDAVWSKAANDYLLRFVFTAQSDLRDNSSTQIFEAIMKIKHKSQQNKELILLDSSKITFKPGITDNDNPDAKFPIEKYQITVNQRNGATFSGMIEDLQNHKKVYSLSVDNRECGTYSGLLKEYNINKMCITNIQVMINDCNIDLTDKRFSIGKAIPIDNKSAISVIYKKVAINEYDYINTKLLPKNETSEIYSYIYRYNLNYVFKEPFSEQIGNFCEIRQLERNTDKQSYEYNRIHQIFYDFTNQSINIQINRISNLPEERSTFLLQQKKSNNFIGVKVFVNLMSKFGFQNRQKFIIEFTEVGYSSPSFSKDLYIEFLNQDSLTQTMYPKSNILSLRKLRGNSKYKIDVLNSHIFQMNLEKMNFVSRGMILNSKDLSIIGSDVRFSNEFNTNNIISMFSLGAGFIALNINHSKYLHVYYCSIDILNSLICSLIKRVNNQKFIQSKLTVDRLGNILVVYGPPKFDKDGSFLIELSVLRALNQVSIVRSSNFENIHQIIFLKSNNQALLYYLSKNNKIIIFKINSTGKESTSSDLDKSFEYLNAHSIPYTKDPSIKWGYIYPSKKSGFFTYFSLYYQSEDGISIEQSNEIKFTKNNQIEFINQGEYYRTIGTKYLQVCDYNFVRDRLSKSLKSIYIERTIYTPESIEFTYKIERIDLFVRDIVECICLPKEIGIMIIADSIYKNRDLILLNSHPGNYGYMQSSIMAKFIIDKEATSKNISFNLRKDTLELFYAHGKNKVRRWTIKIGHNNVIVKLGSKLNFDYFTSKNNTQIPFNAVATAMVFDKTTPKDIKPIIYYDSNEKSDIKDQKIMPMVQEFEIIDESKPKLEISKVKNDLNSKFMIKKGENYFEESILVIDGEYQGVEIVSKQNNPSLTKDKSDPGSPSKNNKDLTTILEEEVKVQDRVQKIESNSTKDRAYTFDFIDSYNEYTLMCQKNEGILLYKNIGTEKVKLLFNSTETSSHKYFSVQFSKQYKSSEIPFIFFIGGIQGIIGDDNQYTSKIMVFYFRKNEINPKILTFEITQSKIDNILDRNNFISVDYSSLQSVVSQSEEFKNEIIVETSLKLQIYLFDRTRIRKLHVL